MQYTPLRPASLPRRGSTLGLLVALAACGDNGHGQGVDGPPGSADGPPGQPDALSIDAPEGEADAPAADAGPADASPPDAGPPDADPGTATVRVTQEDFDPSPGAPLEGARIAVLDPGGGPPTVFLTDATGTATFPVPPASQVWVGRDPVGTTGDAASGQLYFIQTVSPGDMINLGAPAWSGPVSSDGTLTLTYTPLPGTPQVNPDDYISDCTTRIFAPAPEIKFEVEAGCGAPSRELVITAGSVDAPQGFLNVPAVSGVPGTVDATALEWNSGTVYSATHSGFPTPPPGVDIYVAMNLGAPGSWHWIGLPSLIAGGSGSATTSGARLTSPMVAYAEIDPGFPSTTRSQYTSDPVTDPTNIGINGSTLLPFITGPSFSGGTRTVTWGTEMPGAVDAQLVTVSFSYFDNIHTSSFRWTLYAPGPASSIVFPDVPDEVTTHDLTPSGSAFPDALLVYAEGSSFSDLLTDYDLYRFDRYRNYRNKLGFRTDTLSRVSGGGFFGIAASVPGAHPPQ